MVGWRSSFLSIIFISLNNGLKKDILLYNFKIPLESRDQFNNSKIGSSLGLGWLQYSLEGPTKCTKVT